MSGFQMNRVEADGIELIARRRLADFCNEVADKGCAPANAVALMVKECVDALGEIDEALTLRFLRRLSDAYDAKLAGPRRGNALRMTRLALVIQDLLLIELQKFGKTGRPT